MAQLAKYLKAGLTCLALGPSGLAAQDVSLRLEDEDLRRVLRDASLTYALRRDDDAVPEDFVAAARADYRRLLTGLYSQGYYSGTISIRIDGREAADLAPLDAPARIETIEIMVDPGPRFDFGRAEIGPLPDGTILPEGFAPGEPARSDTIRTATNSGIDAWRNEGHAQAEVSDQTILAHHPDQRLDAVITLAPGPVLRFGPLNVTSESAVRRERIIEIAGLGSDTYSPEQLDRAASRLRRTGAFQSVSLTETNQITNGDRLIIDAQVIDMPQRRLGAGVEYSTVEGLTLTGYWLNRNLLGGAERFETTGEITGIGGTTGGIDYELGLSYGRPATLNPDTDLFANLNLQRIDDPGYRLDQFSGDIGLTKTINDWLIYNVGLGYLTADVTDDLGNRSYSYLTFPVSAQADRRDDTLNPTSGFFARLEATPFARIGENDRGVRLYGDGRIYQGVADDRVVLAFRGQWGAVWGVEGADAPADYLFYSGGGGTVRGQPYQSLGVTSGTTTIGGRSFFGAQTEARVNITESIGVVGFVDTGFIGNGPFDLQNGEWQSGAGIGARYNTGIGPIRFDIAAPVTDSDEGLQFYIGIGQSF